MVFCKILTKNVVYIKKDDKGFTLIELIVVLSLMSVLSALVYPQFSKFQNKLALKQAANQLAADIRYIKQKAIANEGTSNNFILLEADKLKGDYLYRIIVTGAREREVNFKETYGNKLTIEEIAFPGNKIQFNYFGNLASRSGHVLLQSKDGEKMYVIIHNVMGRVRVDTQDPQGNY